MKNFAVREDQLQVLVNYLVSRPYIEVAQMIDMLQKVPVLPAVVPDKTAPERTGNALDD